MTLCAGQDVEGCAGQDVEECFLAEIEGCIHTNLSGPPQNELPKQFEKH